MRRAMTMAALAAVLVANPARADEEPPSAPSAAPAPTKADAPDNRTPKAILTIQIENDFLSRWARSDRDYTNGIRLGWLSAPVAMPRWLASATTVPTFLGERKADSVVRRWGVSIGQNLYTPADTGRRDLIANDRPYAGWAYIGFALQYAYVVDDQPVRLDTIQLDIGVVGPAAAGRFSQNNWHTLIGADKARGWRNQLRNEPTVNLTFERRWRVGRLDLSLPLGLESDVIPRIGVAVGNVATYAAIGGTIRIGNDLRNDFGPPRARPSMPGSETFGARDGFGWYVFAGVDGQAYARNIFLDGNTFRDSHNVDRRPFVLDVQAGVALLFRSARVSLTHVLRSPEFSEQRRWAQFGSVSVAFRY
ncbi:MAG: lipid A deacylase LpxR family protein [Rhodospirillales bacterium]|nr:MAG: lipid A deacylase LpxR family protein [Rhodospirillales bacterium]